MPKPALGRGLASLLTPRPQAQPQAEAAATATRAEVTPGVAALIEGVRASREVPGQSSPASAAPVTISVPKAEAEALPARMHDAASSTLLRGLLVGADFLLCLMAILFVRRTEVVQLHELLLCLAAVLVGAALAAVAFCLRRF